MRANRVGTVRTVAVAILAVTALVPLVYVPEFMYPYVVPRALLLRVGIGLGAALLLWVTATVRTVSVDYRDPIFWSLVALTVVSVGASLAGPAPQHSLVGDFQRMWGSLQWGYLTVLYLVMRALIDDRAWGVLLRVVLYVALGVALFGVVEFATARMFPMKPGDSTVSTLGNHGYLGAYMLLSAGLAVLVAGRSEGKVLPAIWGTALVALFGFVLLLSGSRAALAGGVVGGVAAVGIFLLARSGRWRSTAGWMLGGLAGAGLLAVTAWGVAPDALLEVPVLARLSNTDPLSGGLAARFGAWEAGIKGLSARPLTGWGMENFSLVYDRFVDSGMHRVNPGVRMFWDRPHNVLLGNLVHSGPAGLVAYLAVWGSLFAVGVQGWRRGRLETAAAAGLLLSLSGYFTYLQFWFEDHGTAVLLVTLAAYLRHRCSGTCFFELRQSRDLSVAQKMTWGTACLGVVGLALWFNGQSGLAAHRLFQARAADGLEPSVRHYDEARRLQVPQQRSVALEYGSAMATLGLESGSRLRGSDSLRSLYSRGVEGADRALTPTAEHNPLDARLDATRGRLAAGAAMVFAGEGVRDLARESLRQAVEESPRLLEHRHTLASVEALFGNLETARKVLREALRLYDGYGRTYYLLAQMRASETDSIALQRLRQAFWLNYYPEEKDFLRHTVAKLLDRGQAESAERLLTVYVASRYRPALRRRWDHPYSGDRSAFLESRSAEIEPIGREDRVRPIISEDLPLLAMWPRVALTAGNCSRAELATEILLNGLSEAQHTASLQSGLTRQLAWLRMRCRGAAP